MTHKLGAAGGSARLVALSTLVALILAGARIAEAQLNPFTRGPLSSVDDLRGDFVTAGVCLRGTGGQTSNLIVTGIPSGSAVKEAILYWDVLGDDPMPAGADTLTFAGQTLAGTLIGATASPCQPMAKSYAFRRDVTPWVRGNGGYAIAGFLDGGNAALSPVCEGASLVVIYSNLGSLNRDILTYDGAGLVDTFGATVTTVMSGFDGSTPVTSASVAFIVADGDMALTDSVVYQGFTLGSDTFDGSDPPASIPYWDTDGFDVTAFTVSGATSATAEIKGFTDCLVWVACPLSISSPSPDVDVVTENLTPIVLAGTPFRMDITSANSTSIGRDVVVSSRVYRGNASQGKKILDNLLLSVPGNGSAHANYVKNVPASIRPQLRGVPLYVVTTLKDSTSGQVLDVDHVVVYVY